jgi:uroporphyrinogen decarboxylase
MMNPRLWRKLLKPYYEKLFAIGKRRGLPIWFHSCGDVTAVLPDLIEIGMDVWETVELHTLPISASRLKQEYGNDIAFFGGVNTQALPFKTPNEVADEVRRCIDSLGQGGGYICGPDHHIKPDVSAANAIALFEAARSYAQPGYTLQTNLIQ